MTALDLPDACDGERRAVAESLRLLDTSWTAWCAERDISPVRTPTTHPPVVYRVGLEPDFEWVALIRFDVVVDGRPLHGLVRGPADAVVFSVHGGTSDAAADGSGRGPRRRRTERDDQGRHRRFGLA